ncbi:hypothetical protein GOODEAATRI_010212 [Goodea atripinnis]|uniref:Secreted protein n=1 Tax=Goodea atripinnis TaxID=208336 RepID=A0ABV0PWV4_9TELE
MFAELLCGAVALVLYVNTLGADFCYDDRRAASHRISIAAELFINPSSRVATRGQASGINEQCGFEELLSDGKVPAADTCVCKRLASYENVINTP